MAPRGVADDNADTKRAAEEDLLVAFAAAPRGASQFQLKCDLYSGSWARQVSKSDIQ